MHLNRTPGCLPLPQEGETYKVNSQYTTSEQGFVAGTLLQTALALGLWSSPSWQSGAASPPPGLQPEPPDLLVETSFYLPWVRWTLWTPSIKSTFFLKKRHILHFGFPTNYDWPSSKWVWAIFVRFYGDLIRKVFFKAHKTFCTIPSNQYSLLQLCH